MQRSLALCVMLIGLVLAEPTADPPCAGFNVGSDVDETTPDLVWDGVAQPPYDVAPYAEFQPSTVQLDMYLTLNSTARQGLPPTETVDISAWTPNPHAGFTIQLSSAIATISTTSVVHVTASFICYQANMSAYGLISFRFPQNWGEVQLRFNKPCELPLMNVGTTQLNNNIMLDNNLVAPANYVEQNVKTVFFFTLNPASQVKPQPYRVNWLTSSNAVVAADWTKNNLPANVYKRGAPAAWVAINYTCPPAGVSAQSTIVINFDFYFEDSYNITFTKACGPLPTPPSPSPSGWSGFGIFCFTVFIITVVVCVAGCGYKFVKEEKTGIEIIPGISYYRACYEKVFPEKKYTPQEDDKSGGSSYGATSYQTDL